MARHGAKQRTVVGASNSTGSIASNQLGRELKVGEVSILAKESERLLAFEEKLKKREAALVDSERHVRTLEALHSRVPEEEAQLREREKQFLTLENVFAEASTGSVTGAAQEGSEDPRDRACQTCERLCEEKQESHDALEHAQSLLLSEQKSVEEQHSEIEQKMCEILQLSKDASAARSEVTDALGVARAAQQSDADSNSRCSEVMRELQICSENAHAIESAESESQALLEASLVEAGAEFVEHQVECKVVATRMEEELATAQDRCEVEWVAAQEFKTKHKELQGELREHRRCAEQLEVQVASSAEKLIREARQRATLQVEQQSHRSKCGEMQEEID